MPTEGIQYVSDERGEVTAVVVPIAVWREMSADMETQHLLSSEAMKRRLLGAMGRSGGVPFDEVLSRLGITEDEDE